MRSLRVVMVVTVVQDGVMEYAILFSNLTSLRMGWSRGLDLREERLELE